MQADRALLQRRHPMSHYFSSRRPLLFLILLIALILIWIMTSTINDKSDLHKAPLRHLSCEGLTEEKTSDLLDPNSKYTVVMCTFNRLDLYRKAVEYYANMPSIDQFILVWNNVDLKKFPLPHQCEFNTKTKVLVLAQNDSEIQNRYTSHPYIRTTRVLNVDDDILIHYDDILLGWNMSKHFSQQLVGYSGRLHERRPDGTFYYTNFIREKYSIVIGAAFWAPPEFYRWYTSHSNPAALLRQKVIEHQCCDDIAMNMIVSYHTGLPPVLIGTSRVQKFMSKSGFRGQSKAKGWMSKRGNTLRDFLTLFNGTDPLKTSNIVVTSFVAQADPLDLRWIKNSAFIEWIATWIG